MKMELCRDGHTIKVFAPMTFQRRGGRKLIIAPDGINDWAQPQPKQDNTLIKAIARARRWQKMLEDGKMPSSRQLAEREKTNPSYLARILRLSLLAPDIVEAILNGRQPKGLLLADLLKPFPVEWDRQRALFGFTPKVY
ncbi:MAG TPA: hypothetical protein QGG18_03725 [Rhodospirillales bacterium]|jgi:hypothetical protein|nr:hypothetical protein [Planctomycetota bacterium]HJN24792.1 hypothetical protein [Rhodospirillales bacterium]|tara:strand:+ start:3242 stop:3658 length:417 start_codon:yes stop_codon:yes gene_type:complete